MGRRRLKESHSLSMKTTCVRIIKSWVRSRSEKALVMAWGVWKDKMDAFKHTEAASHAALYRYCQLCSAKERSTISRAFHLWRIVMANMRVVDATEFSVQQKSSIFLRTLSRWRRAWLMQAWSQWRNVLRKGLTEIETTQSSIRILVSVVGSKLKSSYVRAFMHWRTSVLIHREREVHTRAQAEMHIVHEKHELSLTVAQTALRDAAETRAQHEARARRHGGAAVSRWLRGREFDTLYRHWRKWQQTINAHQRAMTRRDTAAVFALTCGV